MRSSAMRSMLFAFLDLADHDPGIALRDGNADYAAAHRATGDLAGRLANWGYGAGGKVADFTPLCAHPLRRVEEATARVLTAQAGEK